MNTLQMHVHGDACGDSLTLRMTPKAMPQLEIVENGVHHYKTVGIQELLKLLDRSLILEQLKQVDLRRTRLTSLPERVLALDTLESSSSLRHAVTAYVPSFDYPTLYQERVYCLRYPTLVYQVVWEETTQRVLQGRLAVALDDTVRGTTALYRYPFSNVYPSGAVCWSGLHETTCALDDVQEKMLFGFLQTPNNRDLFGVGHSQNSPYRDYPAFLEAVEAEHGVRSEWLIPLSSTVVEWHGQYRV
ncbi:hypothetical protein [Alicyclobacillus sp. SP_1]|uniref:hypothetical protein n=1 Tax=Alicyclobacillus sp. SP_1 TaxID=2942475 RepID=UPI0021574F4D|nr:hypothetical protein [Alicyclobacillus sp. SP_1]